MPWLLLGWLLLSSPDCCRSVAQDAFGGCLAYRYLAFVPMALSSDDVDAVSLAGITFTYR